MLIERDSNFNVFRNKCRVQFIIGYYCVPTIFAQKLRTFLGGRRHFKTELTSGFFFKLARVRRRSLSVFKIKLQSLSITSVFCVNVDKIIFFTELVLE